MNALRRCFVCAASFVATSLVGAEPAVEYPQLKDDRLEITLYASDPDIVTPIGAAVDAEGRLFVIECHTHNPPADYSGPQGDVIKVFEGEREDKRFSKMSVFADGLFQAQALKFDKHGRLYVVCTREVLILHDRDGDLRSESRTRILNLDPYAKRGNPHGQMQGIAFSDDGQLYVGAGTTEDDWIASDGKRLRVGPYWGGILVRCEPDGTELERFAWGFWNPYAMTFDRRGRLIAIDNDPDHRGPNRLLHIVQGGDYGFKRTYGRYGLHPYQAWNGELPGTLPMIAGIGEAPTAVLDANQAALPPDYRDAIIGASWGEHNLTLFRPVPSGVSLAATPEVLLEGEGHDNTVSPFRPSGLSASPVDGSIYISDWMLIDYTTHGKGRIWKIAAQPGVTTDPPRKPYADRQPTRGLARLAKLANAARIEQYPSLRRALTEPDPFVRNAAVTAMAQPIFRSAVLQDLEHADAKVRLGALLALRRADVQQPATYIEPRLTDADPNVVQMAMIWAGESQLKSLAGTIDKTASQAGLSRSFLQTWLATMNIMEDVKSPSRKAAGSAFKLQRQPRPAFIKQLASDENRPVVLRAMAIRWLQNLDAPENQTLLHQLAQGAQPELRIEAIRRLAESRLPESTMLLLDLAQDRTQPPGLRAEALTSLSGKPDASLLQLLDDPEPVVRLEAARAMRKLIGNPEVHDAVSNKLQRMTGETNASKLRSQLEFLLAPQDVSRPDSLAGWQELLAEGGDPEAGQRVFFSANSECVTCHTLNGRGIKLGSGPATGFIAIPVGPDLSVIARTADREAIIHSIVKPSDNIAPEYQGWFVQMRDGTVTTGRQIDQESNAIQLITLDGHEHDFPRRKIQSWGAMSTSLMPEDLPKSMAIEELRDLVAFLSTLK